MKSKLVRDLIPAIIRETGKYPVTHIAVGEEAKAATIAKVREEIGEFADDPSLEEAADIYHAFMALLSAHYFTFDDVIAAAVKKAGECGRFHDMIVLDEVLDEEKV